MARADDGVPYAAPTIRILGPISVDAPGRHPGGHVGAVTELLVYLALHPHGVDLDTLTMDVWQRANVGATSVHSVLSRARCWLRVDGRGEGVIVHGGWVTLADHVGFDWRLFDALSSGAYGRGREAHADLCAALALVRGPAFHGRPPHRYGWLGDRLLEYEIPAAIVDVASHLASIRSETGDWAGVRAAARRGLDADPCAEILWRILLRAECALGNLAQAGVIARTLIRDGDDLEPETVALLNELPAPVRHRAVAAVQ